MKAIKNSLRKNMRSYHFALKGIREVWKGNNFKYQLTAAFFTIILGGYLELNSKEWIIVSIMIGLVLSAEAFNSAIEILVDLVSPEHSLQAGKVKDISAGAVLIMAMTALVAGLLIFLPKFINL